MRRCSHLFALISLLLLHSAPSFGQAWSGILAPARATDWSYAGIPGGIPSGSWSNCTTTACNTAFSSPTVANVISACAGAPNNTVVRIPAGSYTWSSSVYCNRGNVALRGAGSTQTTINLGSGANILMGGQGTGGQGAWPTGVGTTNWTGGLTQGSTVLTVGSTSGMSAGQTVILTQQNAPYVYTTGVEGPCTSGNSCGVNVSAKTFNGSSTWAQMQLASIVSVNSGANQITIAAPGAAITYQSSLSPVVFYWNTPHNAQYAGIENMTVNANNNDHVLSLPFCDYCWVQNVAITNAFNRGNIFFYFGYRDEAINNYLGGDTSTGHPTQYGIELLETTFALIQNNITVDVTTPVITEGSYGTVLGYNYMRRTVVDNEFGALVTHLAHAFMQLWEGNVVGMMLYDTSWGSSSHMTTFRDYANGNDPKATNYRIPLSIQSHNEYNNVIGNVLGDPTHHTTYVCDISNDGASDTFIYDLGIWDGCISGTTTNYDATVESSLVRWGNWDAVTYNASGSGHHGTRWCTGSGTGSSGSDAYNNACTASETANADPNYPGLSSPSTTLPASFYLSAKPGWFTTPWGTPVYPAIGPDVTCSTNCSTNTSNHAALTPAQLCYNNTAKDSNGFLTAFDANVCYASGSGSTPPSPPTGLTAVVQ